MSVQPKREWVGESGYCNCLLVSMVRSSLQSVTLFGNQTLPDLLEMTNGVPDTNAWVKAQEFDLATLDSRLVIRMLVDLAKMGNWPWSSRSGEIPIVDVAGENESPVERTFLLTRSKANGVTTLEVVLKFT